MSKKRQQSTVVHFQNAFHILQQQEYLYYTK